MKIAWGITGAGDKLLETLEIIRILNREKEFDFEVFLSKAGLLVSKYYNIYEELVDNFEKVWLEKDANTPFLAGRLQMKEFASFIVAPATSNTIAKVAVGISDTLLTNAIIQGIKGNIPVYIMPTDLKVGETITILPNGRELKLRVRKEDVLNVNKLKDIEGIKILERPEQLIDVLKILDR
ncbi:archaeoflavoprotein AfpA [Candidatus Bathyarchaeota archaeon]|nr:archaeoflavoprotein AfpA [Candidatus Bathyarchaeota archaeon]